MKLFVCIAIILFVVFNDASVFALEKSAPIPPIEPLKLLKEKEEVPTELTFQTYYIFNLEDSVVWYGKCTNWHKSFEGGGSVGDTKVLLEGANYETQIIRVSQVDFEFFPKFNLLLKDKMYEVTLLSQKEQEKIGMIYFKPDYLRTTFFLTPHTTEMSVENLQKMDSFVVGGVRFKAENLFVVSNRKGFQVMGLSERTQIPPLVAKGAKLEIFDNAGNRLGEIIIGHTKNLFVMTYKYFGDFWVKDNWFYGISPVGHCGVINGAKGVWQNIGLKLEDRNNDKMYLQVVAPFKCFREMIFVTVQGRVWKIEIIDSPPSDDFYKLTPSD